MRCRFTRLANGGSKVAIADLQSLPELNGNPFISRVFQLSDADRDGYLSQKEFMAGVEKLGHLYTDDDKLACKLQACASLRSVKCLTCCPDLISGMCHETSPKVPLTCHALPF